MFLTERSFFSSVSYISIFLQALSYVSFFPIRNNNKKCEKTEEHIQIILKPLFDFSHPLFSFFFLFNDISYDERSERIAIASLVSFVLSALNAGSCFAIFKVSFNPLNTAGASIKSSHREEAGS